MIKGLATTVSFLFIFFFGVNYALVHPKLSREIMATVGVTYNK